MLMLLKGQKKRVSRYFAQHELDCNCISSGCTMTLVEEEFLLKADSFREHMGCPLYLTNSYRCPYYNEVVTGKPLSNHMRGGAGDFVKPPYINIQDFADAARLFFPYVKIYESMNFIHCDIYNHG